MRHRVLALRGAPSVRAAGIVAGGLVLGMLVGCDGIGSGSAPTGISITLGDYDDEYRTFECAAFNLTATAHFRGGSTREGDVTGRVLWRSSNPGVIDVSNGDIETEPGSGEYYAAGMVIARSPGTASISADYVGLRDSFSVTARPIAAMWIEPALTRMAPSSTQAFELKAELEDDTLEVDLTQSAIWSLPSVGAPAEIDGSVVAAVSDPLDKPFDLLAQLFTCDRTARLGLQLGAVSQLRLTAEQPADLPVPIGLSDEIRAEAVFADPAAPAQNLSAQLEIEQIQGDADQSAIAVSDYLVLNGYVTDTPQQYRLRYRPLDLTADTRVYRFVDLEIQSLRVSPTDVTLFYPDTLQLEAYGRFGDGYERPVRRDVSWQSLNDDLVAVTIGGAEQGLLTPTELEGEATVRATTANSEGELHADADIRVNLD